jgi:hypothetical protein
MHVLHSCVYSALPSPGTEFSLLTSLISQNIFLSIQPFFISLLPLKEKHLEESFVPDLTTVFLHSSLISLSTSTLPSPLHRKLSVSSTCLKNSKLYFKSILDFRAVLGTVLDLSGLLTVLFLSQTILLRLLFSAHHSESKFFTESSCIFSLQTF